MANPAGYTRYASKPREGIRSKFNLTEGEVIRIPDLGPSFYGATKATVEGIDRYTSKTAAGNVNSWVSYTLETEEVAVQSKTQGLHVPSVGVMTRLSQVVLPKKAVETEMKRIRFWAVDGQAPVDDPDAAIVPRSFYVEFDQGQPPIDFRLDRDLSGYVDLRSEGNAALSGGSVGRGSLFTYRTDEGAIWAEEVFEGAERLEFIAVFEPEGFEL